MGSLLSLFFDGVALASSDEVAGEERRRRREDQSQGAARERLLRALPGTETSEGNMGGAWARGGTWDIDEVAMWGGLFVGEIKWRWFWNSSLEKESSTKFESHSSSAKSSYCSKKN